MIISIRSNFVKKYDIQLGKDNAYVLDNFYCSAKWREFDIVDDENHERGLARSNKYHDIKKELRLVNITIVLNEKPFNFNIDESGDLKLTEKESQYEERKRKKVKETNVYLLKRAKMWYVKNNIYNQI
jgi:hypothetical protein